MSFFRCCGQSRKPWKVVEITPPRAAVRYLKLGIRLDREFKTITISEFHCPSCKSRTGDGIFYIWQGNYAAHNKGLHGKSQVQKINLLEEPEWVDWMITHAVLTKVKGAGRVDGCLPISPFNKRSVEVR